MHINRFYELQNTNVNKNNGGKRPNCAHVAMRKLAIIQCTKRKLLCLKQSVFFCDRSVGITLKKNDVLATFCTHKVSENTLS